MQVFTLFFATISFVNRAIKGLNMKETKTQTQQASELKVKTLQECIETDEFNGLPGSYIYDPVSGTRSRLPSDNESPNKPS